MNDVRATANARRGLRYDARTIAGNSRQTSRFLKDRPELWRAVSKSLNELYQQLERIESGQVRIPRTYIYLCQRGSLNIPHGPQANVQDEQCRRLSCRSKGFVKDIQMELGGLMLDDLRDWHATVVEVCEESENRPSSQGKQVGLQVK